jgi:hypothetical protein
MPVVLGEKVATELSAAKLAIHNMVESTQYMEQGVWMSWLLIKELIEKSTLNHNRDTITAKANGPTIDEVTDVARSVLREINRLPANDRRHALVAIVLETVRCTAGMEAQIPF